MIVKLDIELDEFEDSEIISYAKEYLDMIERGPGDTLEEAVDAMETLKMYKKSVAGLGDWVNIKEELRELLED